MSMSDLNDSFSKGNRSPPKNKAELSIQKACIKELYKIARTHGASDAPMPDAKTLELMNIKKREAKLKKKLDLEAKLLDDQRKKHEELERAERKKYEEDRSNTFSCGPIPKEHSNVFSCGQMSNVSPSFDSDSINEAQDIADNVIINSSSSPKSIIDIVNSVKKKKNQSVAAPFSIKESLLKILLCHPENWSESIEKELKQDFCFCVEQFDDYDDADEHMTLEDRENYHRFKAQRKLTDVQKSETDKKIGKILSVPSSDLNQNSDLALGSKKKKKLILVGAGEKNSEDYESSINEKQPHLTQDQLLSVPRSTEKNLDRILEMVDGISQTGLVQNDDEETFDMHSDESSDMKARRTVEQYAATSGRTIEDLLLEVESQYTASTRGQSIRSGGTRGSRRSRISPHNRTKRSNRRNNCSQSTQSTQVTFQPAF